jgi:ferredoxin
MGYRFDEDWSIKEIQEVNSEIVSSVAIPVNIRVEAEQKVFDFESVKTILKKARLIVLQDCRCRSKLHHCDAPLNTCILLDDWAEKRLVSESRDSKHARQVSFDEAVAALEGSHRAGLVHMAYTREGDDYPKTICSCCSCCCHALSGLIRYGIPPVILPSGYAAVDGGDCVGCGRCVDRCHFTARSLVDGKMLYDDSKCYGCGLCITECPTTNIRLERR